MTKLPVLMAFHLALAGCASALPQVGPNAEAVVSQASENDMQRYDVVDIDDSVLNVVLRRRPDSFASTFGSSLGATSPVLGVGDILKVTIWEAGPGGMFSSTNSFSVSSTGSNSATIPDQAVSRNGTITIPFAGEVRAAGRTTQSVQDDIVKALQGKAIQPQALVSLVHPVSSTVTVAGEVSQGARVPLSLKGDRLMDVIAEAGGVRIPVGQAMVHLTRGSRTLKVPLRLVMTNPRENIYMRPGDLVTITREPQAFIAYGATGANAEIPFDTPLTVATALGRAGGLIDSRSDPAGVFILRYEPAEVVRKVRPDSTLAVAGHLSPVVYRLNMRDTKSLFIAQRFPVFDKDVIYVTNAPITDVQKALQVFTIITSPTAAAASVYSAIR